MGLAFLEVERGQWSWSMVSEGQSQTQFEERPGPAVEALEVIVVSS